MKNEMTPTQAFEAISCCELKIFDSHDFDAFSGVEDEKPLIGYYDGFLCNDGVTRDFTIIVDGPKLIFYATFNTNVDEYAAFELVRR